MEGYITMSNKEIDRFKVLQKMLDPQLLQKEATTQLGLSVRQLKRLATEFEGKSAYSPKKGKT